MAGFAVAGLGELDAVTLAFTIGWVLFIVLLIVGDFIGRWDRRRLFQEMADEHGWSYSPRLTRRERRSLHFARGLRARSSTSHALRGEWRGRPMLVFGAADGSSETTLDIPDMTYVVIELTVPYPLPRISIGPRPTRTVGDRLRNRLRQAGMRLDRSITFDSAAFTDAYEVRCDNEHLARQLCGPELIDYLLHEQAAWFDIKGRQLVLSTVEGVRPSVIRAQLEQAHELIERLSIDALPAKRSV